MPKPAALLLLVLSGLGAAGSATGLATQQPTFRAATRTVSVYATAQDGQGSLVTDLSREDFEIFEDGAPREIVQFSSDPQPLNVVVMLETSQRMLGTQVPLALRTHARDAIMAFVAALRPEDRARIGTFGLQIALGAHLTNDGAELRRVLDEETWAGGEAPLWQALIAGMRSIEGEPNRRVVLVLTNGDDRGSVPGFTGGRSNVDRQAAACGCMLYAVKLEGRDVTDDLKDVATTSGGGYIRVSADDDLSATFVRIAEELRHQYLIGFVPEASDGLPHGIGVRARRPGLIVRARQTFIAGAE